MDKQKLLKNIDLVLISNIIISLVFIIFDVIFKMSLGSYLIVSILSSFIALVLLYAIELKNLHSILILAFGLKIALWIGSYYNLFDPQMVKLLFHINVGIFLGLFSYRIYKSKHLQQTEDSFYYWTFILLSGILLYSETTEGMEFLRFINYFVVGVGVNIRLNEKLKEQLTLAESKIINLLILISCVNITLLLVEQVG